MKKVLSILALFISLSTSISHAQDYMQDTRIERAIIRSFPLEQIWANTLLKLNLSDKKIVRLRPVFQTFWDHRQQMLEGAKSEDRIKVRERTDALKYKLKQELSKHLEPGQVRAVISPYPPLQNPSSPRSQS